MLSCSQTELGISCVGMLAAIPTQRLEALFGGPTAATLAALVRLPRLQPEPSSVPR